MAISRKSLAVTPSTMITHLLLLLVVSSCNVPICGIGGHDHRSEEAKKCHEGECAADTDGGPIDGMTDVGDSGNLGTKSGAEHESMTSDGDVCRLYLAESSIPGAGFGMYAGVNFSPRETVSIDNIIHQFIDVDYHGDENTLLSEYAWSAGDTGGIREAWEVASLVPGLGMMGNHHAKLHNVEKNWVANKSVGKGGRKDPGAGASSSKGKMAWEALVDIEQGSEMFLHYGEDYFTSRQESLGLVPFIADFVTADTLMKNFDEFANDKLDFGRKRNCVKQGIWNMALSLAEPRVRGVLPDDLKVLSKAREKGSALHSLPNVTRSMEWLRKNGQCLDNLHFKNSTIPHAGLGAFASRFTAEGGLLSPVPLLHIKDRISLDIYDFIVKTDGTPEVNTEHKKVVSAQLITNYCFGHANSSIRLFPLLSGVHFINHKSDNPNAAIRWSNSSFHHSEWLLSSVEDIPLQHSGLMLDIVATRDIFPGEEVSIDYGKEWEEAWDKHVQEWIAPPDEYVLPHVMNANTSKPFKTVMEQKNDPYPRSVRTGCRHYYNSKPEDEDLEKVEASHRYFPPIYNQHIRPCDILTRRDNRGAFVYNAKLYANGYDDNEFPRDQEYIILNIPHESINFIERSYTSDQHLRNAFRHVISIPDKIFPASWRNL